MKYLIAVIAVMFALSVTPAEARRPSPRLWSPGIIMRLTYEGFMMNRTGPRLVWRGDWVPVTNRRGR